MLQDIKEIEGLRVKVDDIVYMPSLEAPADRPHPFVYFISIFNHSESSIKILGRKWVVREEMGEIHVVEGEGVVGLNPIIGPGEHFSYNSYHVIRDKAQATGAFFGETEQGERFFVKIPLFSMDIEKWI